MSFSSFSGRDHSPKHPGGTASDPDEVDDGSPDSKSDRLRRYALTVAYRGTAYHGWQQQGVTRDVENVCENVVDALPTVQATLRRAIVAVVRHPVNLVGSSRTDAGVHAKGQIAHFDTDQRQIPPEGLRRAVNSRLPHDVEVRDIRAVPDDFDAISSAIGKRYQYAIWDSPRRPVLFGDLVWHRPPVKRALNLDAMAEAGGRFVGTHDFTSFARPGHGRATTVRTVTSCTVRRRAGLVVIGVEGTGFLWNMVRILVGTLADIGVGRYRPDDVPIMLASRDRSAAGGTAPPTGLYLHWVRFPGEGDPGQSAADGAFGSAGVESDPDRP